MKDITAILLGISLALAGVYDLYAAVKWGPEATISDVIQHASQQWPILPFAVGVLIGHLFWPKGLQP